MVLTTVGSIQPAILTSFNRKQDFIRLIIITKQNGKKCKKKKREITQSKLFNFTNKV